MKLIVMHNIQETCKKQSHTFKKSHTTEDTLRHLAFDNTAQSNIIFTVSNGKIIMTNNAACKLLGYSKKELLTKSMATILDINEGSFKKMLKQKMAKGHFTALVTAIKKSGRTLPCEISSVPFMDEDGIVNAIATITDLSQSILNQKNRDAKKEKIVADNILLAKAKSDVEKLDHEMAARGKLLTEYKENFKLIFNSSSDILYDVDLVANKVVLSDAYEKEFGYQLFNNTTSTEDLFSHIHPGDKRAFMKDYLRMIMSEDSEWKYSFRFLRADDSIANVVTRGIVMRNTAGEAYRRIGYMKDISNQKVLEERLEQEIKLKEIQIAEAAEDAKDTERSDIGKELHDNINQLLGASRLYLEMAKRGGEQSEMYLSRSSEYTLQAIEEIRKLTKGLTTDIIKNLGLCDAIDNVTRDAMEVNPVKISYASRSFKEHSVNDKFKLNIFRIVQEQLNNILKHAKATEVSISLLQNKRSIILSISDNGVGFDTDKKRKGIGVANINSRAASYNGTAYFTSQPGQGCILTATFPVTAMLLNKN